MRPVQYFSDDYLAAVRTTSPDEVVEFLENFREMHAPGARSRLISSRPSISGIIISRITQSGTCAMISVNALVLEVF